MPNNHAHANSTRTQSTLYIVPRHKNPPKNSNKGRKTEVYAFKDINEVARISNYLYTQSSDTPAYRYRNYLFFSLGLNMGFRASDLVRLQWKHIFRPHTNIFNNEDWNVLVEKKTSKTRQIVINTPAQKAITIYLNSMSITPEDLNPDDYLFPSRKSTTPHILPDNMRVIIKKAAKACDIPFNVGTHSLRKTFGYNLYQSSGKDIAMVQHLLNHADQNVTTHYIGIDQEATRKAYGSLQDLVWEP